MDNLENNNLTPQELIARFAEINNISEEAADELIGAETSEEILKRIANYTKNKIDTIVGSPNRKQRRAAAKMKNKNTNDIFSAIETAKKLSYIDLILKLQDLNERKQEEDNEGINENN